MKSLFPSLLCRKPPTAPYFPSLNTLCRIPKSGCLFLIPHRCKAKIQHLQAPIEECRALTKCLHFKPVCDDLLTVAGEIPPPGAAPFLEKFGLVR